jgi:hypothetical protein
LLEGRERLVVVLELVLSQAYVVQIVVLAALTLLVPQVNRFLVQLYALLEVLQDKGHASGLLLDDVGALVL